MMIEPATAEDLEEILALQKLAFASEAARYNDDTLPPLTQTLEEIRADFEKMVFLKASVDGRIVGSVRAYAKGDTCFIGRLVVHPDFQRRGIGTRLMEAVEERFRGVCRFELFTGHASAPALNLYAKLGYVEFRRKAMPTHTLVFLEKRVK
ncbi:MAG: GNAT family N-acetyltransferase [Anaerolineae bacterium]|nr:GNAT family N-acetyltransferase [Anaerolineae bacterium]